MGKIWGANMYFLKSGGALVPCPLPFASDVYTPACTSLIVLYILYIMYVHIYIHSLIQTTLIVYTCVN